MKQDMIVILTWAASRGPNCPRVCALGVYSEIHPNDSDRAAAAALPGVKGFILNGGPNNVVDGVALEPSKAKRQSVARAAADYAGAPARARRRCRARTDAARVRV